MFDMRRREFITLLGGAAAWPLTARAQPRGSLPRIGFLSDQSERPHPFNARDYFLTRLGELGYEDRRNIVIEYRYGAGDLKVGFRRWRPNWRLCRSTCLSQSARPHRRRP
jgi:hypothetical protein